MFFFSFSHFFDTVVSPSKLCKFFFIEAPEMLIIQMPDFVKTFPNYNTSKTAPAGRIWNNPQIVNSFKFIESILLTYLNNLCKLLRILQITCKMSFGPILYKIVTIIWVLKKVREEKFQESLRTVNHSTCSQQRDSGNLDLDFLALHLGCPINPFLLPPVKPPV